jgi:hypothetical protein
MVRQLNQPTIKAHKQKPKIVPTLNTGQSRYAGQWKYISCILNIDAPTAGKGEGEGGLEQMWMC